MTKTQTVSNYFSFEKTAKNVTFYEIVEIRLANSGTIVHLFITLSIIIVRIISMVLLK